MSNKDLQRVTESVSYIGQAISRRSLPAHRNHITQKVKVAGQRTPCLGVHDDPHLAETFLRLAFGSSVLEAADLSRPLNPGDQHDEHHQTDR